MRKILVFAALLAAGCGDIVSAGVDAGSGDGGNIDAAPEDPCAVKSIPYERVGECVGEAFCENLRGAGLELPHFCVTQPIVHPISLILDDFVKSGTVVYDGAAASECVRAMREAAETVSLGGELSECDLVFDGTLGDGQPCQSSEECGSSGRCESTNCEAQCCLGVCSGSDVPLYAGCDQDGCNAGLHCVENPATMIKTCQAGAEGSPCRSSNECQRDHYCTENETTMLGQCLPDVGENVGCEGDHWCEFPLFCVGDDLTTPGTGTCGRVDTAGDGCDIDNDEDQIFGGCSGALYCKDPTPTMEGECQPLPGESESCAQSMRCNSDELYCNFNNNLCTDRPGEGQSCASAVCAVAFVCLPNGTCGAALADGANCTDAEQCESYLCYGMP